MSEKSGKRMAIGISVFFVILWIAIGLWWYKSTRPQPVAQKPLRTVGVGLYLSRDEDTRQFHITRVFPDSPAAKAGIVPGFILNKVDIYLAETNNIKQVSKLLAGPEGSKVRVELIDTNGETTQVELIREAFLNRSKLTP